MEFNAKGRRPIRVFCHDTRLYGIDDGEAAESAEEGMAVDETREREVSR